MKHSVDFMEAMADFDLDPDTIIWRAGSPEHAEIEGNAVKLSVPFNPFRMENGVVPADSLAAEYQSLYIEFYSGGIIRLASEPGLPADSPMISAAEDLEVGKLSIEETDDSWVINTAACGRTVVFYKKQKPRSGWSNFVRESFDSLSAVFFPDSSAAAFSAYDQFFPEKIESLPLAFLETTRNDLKKRSALFSFHAGPGEHFCGTGERFSRMDLGGKTFTLENTDGLGNNSRRAYKNVPFFLSSRGYGLFIHSSAHMRISLADVSTRAAQGRIEDDSFDLFIINGPEPEKILLNYRRLTGFPPELPIWSYGTWISRMTYLSAEEIEGIAGRLRREEYPCDVIHIDTGWFEKDWVCEWKFSKERFPDPEAFMKGLKKDGFRVSLWQTPNIGEGNCLLEDAKKKHYLAPHKAVSIASASDFSGQDFGGQIDFTNPEAVDWYKGKLRRLLEMGASVIKTDFGEKIQIGADYMNMPDAKLHNIYGLLYQKAAFEEVEQSTGEGIIWARAGWAGCQRYPLHWAGDTASTWDGMAAALRGGLHIGLSGFGYWSHDVPGFHGLPEFMNSYPTDNIYIRWTQMGVFTSHLRYHGTSPREPWFFPEIAPLIRKWWNLRYMLIPYLAEQAKKTAATGMPMLRAMLLHHPGDEICWHIDDQFFCGDNILVCPVMNDRGVRNVYLPEGEWADFWTGETITGPIWLKNIESPLERLPLYCPRGAKIPVYPEPVLCTDAMDMAKTETVEINADFKGIGTAAGDRPMLP